MAEQAFNYDPTGQQKYITQRMLTPQAQAYQNYFSGVPTSNFNWSDSDYYDGYVQNPDFNPTEYRAGYGLEFNPMTGIVTQNLGLTPQELQASANYRNPAVQQLKGAGNAAEVTPEIQALLDSMPSTLNDQQAAAFYQQTGFLPDALPQNQYNWWKGRGYDANVAESFGKGFWEDTKASGDITDLKTSFIKANPALFGIGGPPVEPGGEAIQRSQDLLTPFVQSALFDQGTQGISYDDSPFADIAELTTLNSDLKPNFNGMDITNEQAQALFDDRDAPVYGNVNMPQGGKTYSESGQTPALGLFSDTAKVDANAGQTPTYATTALGQQSQLPASTLFGADASKARLQNPYFGDWSTYGQTGGGTPQHRFFEPTGLTFADIPQAAAAPDNTLPVGQVADAVSPATTQLPASIVSGAVSQAAQNALGGSTAFPGTQFATGQSSGGALGDGGLYSNIAGGIGNLFGGTGGSNSTISGSFDPTSSNPLFSQMGQSGAEKLAELGLGLLPGGTLLSGGAKLYNASGRVKAANDYMAEMGLTPEAGEFGAKSTLHEAFGLWGDDLPATVEGLWSDPKATANLTPAGKAEHDRWNMLNDYGWNNVLTNIAPQLPGAQPYSGSYFTLPTGPVTGGYAIDNSSSPDFMNFSF